ncbi:glycosyltransferase [Camelimonas abortus]
MAMKSNYTTARDTILNNPDIRNINVDPALHYLLYGWKEGRRPSPVFDPVYFQKRHMRGTGREFPLAVYHKKRKAAGLAQADRTWYVPDLPSDAAWQAAPPARSVDSSRCMVVIPVYKGMEETLCSIYHALQGRDGDPYSLLVINDGSPDPELTARLRDLAAKDKYIYIENDKNIGFVATVNKAIKFVPDHMDIILLNSDAYVFSGWFRRMIAHADRDPSVATITPFSNNATICSYPAVDRENLTYFGVAPWEIDQLAGTLNRGRSCELPTGVGFCFYMRRSVIDALGAFDHDAFPIGYGEENDFCMRALAAGYKNILAADVFVYHVGSISFSAIKEKNMKRGERTLLERHPMYQDLVRLHIKADPARHYRASIDIALLTKFIEDGFILVTHDLGGGTETYVQNLCNEYRKNKQKYCVIRVHDERFLSIDAPLEMLFDFPNLQKLDITTDIELVRTIFAKAGAREIIVNSFAGSSWQAHQKMLDIISASGKPFTYVCHDYSCISPIYDLRRPDGLYCGLPTIADRNAWTAMRTGVADICPVEDRLEAYRLFLKKARRVIAPSHAAANIIKRDLTDITIEVTPHRASLPPAPLKPISSADKRLRLAFVGAIGVVKGSLVLKSIADIVARRKLPVDIFVVGYTDIDDDLRKYNIYVSGRYANEHDAVVLLKQLDPHYVFISSVFPETYCYVIDLARAAGVRLASFDIGAQAERISQTQDGIIIPETYINAPESALHFLLEKFNQIQGRAS